MKNTTIYHHPHQTLKNDFFEVVAIEDENQVIQEEQRITDIFSQDKKEGDVFILFTPGEKPAIIA